MALSNETISRLNELHAKAERVYGAVGDNFRGFAALRSEYLEVEQAFQSRDNERLRDELMDLANVATRWAQAIELQKVAEYTRDGFAGEIDIKDGEIHIPMVKTALGIMAESVFKLESEVKAIRRKLDDAETYDMEQLERSE